jgi:EpsI family protein
VVIAAALLVGVGAFERWHRITPVPLPAEMAQFPAAIGRWRVVGVLPSPELEAANFDRTLARRYAAPDGPEIDLLVGYYERQEQGRELVGYDVSRLLVADGPRTSRPLAGDLRVTDFVATVGSDRYLVSFWYVLDGRVVPDGYAAKLWSTWNALARRRSNGSIVIVRTKLPDGVAPDAARAGTLEFLEQILPVSQRYLSS